HSDAPHTVSSDGSGPLNGNLDSTGASYSQTFNQAGDFAYHCNIHAYMHGVVHVTSASSMPPTDALSAMSSIASGPNSPWLLPALAGAAPRVSGSLTLASRGRRVTAEVE